MFQKTIDSSQCSSTHLKTCVVAIDLESHRRFLISLFGDILVVSLSRTIFGLCIYIERESAYARLFVHWTWRVQFCLLVCCTYPTLSTVNKEKNRTDQRASLRVDTRETQQRRRGRQRERWEDNINEWTGLEWNILLRKAENREEWSKLVEKSTVVLQRSARLRDR